MVAWLYESRGRRGGPATASELHNARALTRSGLGRRRRVPGGWVTFDGGEHELAETFPEDLVEDCLLENEPPSADAAAGVTGW